MADENRTWRRQDESFWRAHHEAWKRSDLNQRQYCEAEGIPLKAFGNWRANLKAEPQPPERKLLYRRRGLSHSLSHTLSHILSPSLSHVTYPFSRPEGPIVPRPREGHRRRFGETLQRLVRSLAAERTSLSEAQAWPRRETRHRTDDGTLALDRGADASVAQVAGRSGRLAKTSPTPVRCIQLSHRPQLTLRSYPSQ